MCFIWSTAIWIRFLSDMTLNPENHFFRYSGLIARLLTPYRSSDYNRQSDRSDWCADILIQFIRVSANMRMNIYSEKSICWMESWYRMIFWSLCKKIVRINPSIRLHRLTSVLNMFGQYSNYTGVPINIRALTTSSICYLLKVLQINLLIFRGMIQNINIK